MTTADAHVAEPELARYAAGALPPDRLWPLEAHLTGCAWCRGVLAGQVARREPALAEAGWSRLDAELDAVPVGPVERVLVWAGIPDHLARLLAATPALRRSWLLAMALTVTFALGVGRLAGAVPGLPLLLVAPVLPIVGVAASFGPRVDPTHELALVTPMHGFRLLLLRSGAVLATTCGLGLLGGLVTPTVGFRPFAWLVPALTVTVLSLALSPLVGPTAAAAAVGLGWVGTVGATTAWSAGTPALFTAVGQALVAACGVAGLAVLLRVRDRFDGPARRPLLGRMP